MKLLDLGILKSVSGKRTNAHRSQTAPQVPEHEATEMRHCITWHAGHGLTCLFTVMKRMLSIKIFFFISCIGFAITIIWIHCVDKQSLPSVNDSLVQEALENVARDSRYAEVYRKTNRLPKDIKYILLWTPPDFAPFYFLGEGQRRFIENNCSMINCYVTTDRNFFGGDTRKFDAIAFNGRNIQYMTRSQLPKDRSPHQKFIFFDMESADNYPVCSEIFDGFFNWTSTYRLDSDIPYAYIQIKNNEGEVVGPKRDMDWIEDMMEVDRDFSYRFQNKSKAAAWFVSNCLSRSPRKEFVKNLQKALAPYKLSVDVYGSCGTFKCPIHRKADCGAILERDYFFYLSLENSFAEDYVTEKLLTALHHEVVPIVFGGADYSRFLPPNSYLDALKHTPEELAATMVHLISSPSRYREFFKWKNHYTYHDPTEFENVCAVCTTLNNITMVETPSVYKEFRKWWNPDYVKRCKK